MSVDPRTRRDMHFDVRAKAMKSMGREVRTEALQREVAEDLRMVDRLRAENKLAPPARKKKRHQPKFTKDVARPELHAEALARDVGGKFFARAIKDQSSPFPEDHVRGVDAERRNAMIARIKLLSKKTGRIKANQTIEQGDWEYPAMARAIALTCFAYNARLGGYKDLKAPDRRRRFFRALEDICNRSDALVGVGWWVTK